MRQMRMTADNEKHKLKKQWRAAHKHKYLLEKEQVEELFAFLEEALDETPCDHTLKHTAKWIDQNCPDEQKKAVFEEIREAGGYCDCEVLLNCYEEYDIE